MRAGAKRSNPAATAVWVVKRLPARVTASATSKGWPVSSMKLRARSSTANAACPSFRWQTSGWMPSAREQPPSADPEHQFLLEAQFRPAAVKLAGNASMSGIIRRVIAVQQVKLHSADLNLPGAQPDRVTGQFNLQPQPLAIGLAQRRDRQLSGIVVGKRACCAPSLSITWRK